MKDQEPNTIEASVEVMPPSALEAIERAAIDVQVSTAHKFPRSIVQFKKRAMDMVCLDVDTAESCCYRRPVGMKDGKMQFAEGQSIRMAEIAAACYGNIRVAARIVEQTERHVRCEGVAHDLESNYAGKSESFEPTVRKDGSPFSEGMRAVVAKAALSKAYRDAIFKVIPKAMLKDVYEQAKKVIAGEGKPLAQRRARVGEWLKANKVDDKRMFAALGIKGWDEVGDEQLETLLGIKTAIGDGDTSFDSAFPPVGRPHAEKAAEPAEPQATAQELANPLQTIADWCKRDGVTEDQLLAFCKDPARALAGLKIEQVVQLSDKSQKLLITTWTHVVAKIKSI